MTSRAERSNVGAVCHHSSSDRAGMFLPGRYPRNLSIPLIRWGKFIPRGRRHGVNREVYEKGFDY
jgi:hypothetical protein